MTGSVLLTAKEVKEVEDHIDQLCAEAERYKAEYAMLCDDYGSMSREHSQTIIELSDAYEKIDQLEAENAKLRELVRWMYVSMDESCAVQHPYAPAPISYDLLMQAAARAHELGVEVDK